LGPVAGLELAAGLALADSAREVGSGLAQIHLGLARRVQIVGLEMEGGSRW